MDNFRDMVKKMIELKGKFDAKVEINNEGLNVAIPNSIVPTLGTSEVVDKVLDEVVTILGVILMEDEDDFIEDMVQDGHDVDEEKEKFELVRDFLITDYLIKNFKFQKWCTGSVFKALQSEILYKQVGRKDLIKYAQVRLEFVNNVYADVMESLIFEANEDSLTVLIDKLTDVRSSIQEKVNFDGIKIS